MSVRHRVTAVALLCAGLSVSVGCVRPDDLPGPGIGAVADLSVGPGGADLASSGGADLALLDLAMPDLAQSNDPHDAASCTGAELLFASKFSSGANNVVLATYSMTYEQRSCTDFTGCGSWGPATPSWGPSGSGKLYLKVTGTGIIPAVVDNKAGSAYGTPVYNLGMDCAQKSGVWDCGEYRDTEIVEGSNFLRFEGKDKFTGVTLPIVGEIRATCARFYGSVKGAKTSGSYKEYRGGFLVRY